MKIRNLLVAGMSCVALSAYAQAEKSDQPGEKGTTAGGDQTGVDHKAHAGTSKKAKQTKKSKKKMKQGAKRDQGKMDNMDHSKMENMDHDKMQKGK